ncbi:hopene-associated glycosyltransferase HpnB [Streptomyces sp. 2224.1]|uniref:glycosyltransferase n=1 Tax=unclassified Streptomyces TaxID=2593676 RepID=UPI00088C32C2|nr:MULTISPECIES: glycosyltransferase [unclassified Streptomyces]PBC81119.1 hopene-associated glycosyltransferase HpnB [Streptomyces sp. 2321.6]SDR56307.1 hopene-associated glycosyltransferase HpnB [Streptomyces sp. KS_16]SEC02047.1 hopene-associated glycosyltransferase HpnB [Streptomyces sp. 2133.1]SED26096.1 hopene-associated glycosyltransferase HpnB [Streptomyces sp. 2224.1]SEF10248.1 hopene-associated glycosyltransferase HpnB [Streptomyces sp. 2112.3]
MEWIGAGSLSAWVWLLLGQGFFWRTDVRLPERRDPERWPSVAVVVPARDEAAVLPDSLPSLLGQKYPGRAEVFLVDDGSTDGTGPLARELAAARGGLPLTVASPGEPEPGWTGKLWAVRHGIALARERVAPEYLLLTDADIAHEPDSLRELVAAAWSADLDVVSQMARLRVVTFWERLIVPAFVYFFGQLYPFRWVNRPGARTAAAAGGCVLLRREAAERAGIPEAIRHAVIDDVALARAVQRSGGTLWLGLADRVDSVRPYPRPAELWRMVSRSAYAQLRHRPLLLLGTVLGLALVYLAPPVALVAGLADGDTTAAALGGAAWAVMCGTYLPMLRYYGQRPWWAPLLPFTALLYLLMTVDSAVRHYRGRGAAWKGRTYPAP